MEVIGQVKLIGQTESVGSSGFQKRDIVVTTEDQYPQHITVQFVQDKCDILNPYKVGQSVKIGINLRGREWVSPQGETRYFNTIQGWRIEDLEPSAVKAYEKKHSTTPSTVVTPEEEDNLPF